MLPPCTNVLHRKAPLQVKYEAALKKTTNEKDFFFFEEKEEILKTAKLYAWSLVSSSQCCCAVPVAYLAHFHLFPIASPVVEFNAFHQPKKLQISFYYPHTMKAFLSSAPNSNKLLDCLRRSPQTKQIPHLLPLPVQKV